VMLATEAGAVPIAADVVIDATGTRSPRGSSPRCFPTYP
jgi:hypothetical protein